MEREYVIAVLSFLMGSFGEYFLFYRLAGFLHSSPWMRRSSCPRAFRFFTWSLAWDPFTVTSIPKLIFFIPTSADRRRCYFRFRVLASYLASFFFPPVTECKHLLAFILTWICYFSSEDLTYILFFLQRPAEVDLHSLFLF